MRRFEGMLDLTAYTDQGLLAHLDSLRARIAGEPHADVRAFMGLQLDAVLDEMRLRTTARIAAIAEARVS